VPERAPVQALRQSIEPDAPSGVKEHLQNKDIPGSLGSLDTVTESRMVTLQKSTVVVEYKHSLATRWMHWINFPLLFLMIYSGILIYWADSQHEGLNSHQVYPIGIGNWTLFRFFPPWFYNSLHLKFQLAQGLAYHFFFMRFFALNGVVYVLYTFLSGEWRNLVPTRHSFVGAFRGVLHDLGRECSMEKMAPPVISATKNNLRSAPNTVRGRFIALKTLFLRLSSCREPPSPCATSLLPIRCWVVVGPAAIDCYGKSQAMKFTAPRAMPMPKTMPASIFFDWPSP
jgi:hypothetical protein